MRVPAVLWTAFFIVNFNVAMMIPLLPFIERSIGLTAGESGMVLASFPVMALIGNLALGPAIDRFGRKRFLVAGGVLAGSLLLLTAAAQSAAMIALGRAATGLVMPMIGASVFAAVADYVPAPDRARVAGYVTAAAPVAILASISIGVLLGGLVGWQVPLILLAAICLALAALAAGLPATHPAGLSAEPISVQTYRKRFLSLSLDGATRRLLLAYFCWSAGMYVFLGLYPSWLVQRGLAGEGVGTIGAMVFCGELGGLAGALLSARLARSFDHPFTPCALAALAVAAVLPTVPFGVDAPVFQAFAYWVFAFGRDLMLALILGGAMRLVGAAERGSLNATLNAVLQTGGSLGGYAGAVLYGARPDFIANAFVASAIFALCAVLLRGIARSARAA